MSDLRAGSHVGPYEIVELLGTGGMGEVYRARDSRLNREVAIKVLPDTEGRTPRAERLVAEARLVSTLTHPHIRAIYDTLEHDGMYVIVMEYLDGETLEHRLARKPLTITQALQYGEQLAQALDAAHSQGIVHRDVKPANIMLTKGGVKLLDFGIATLREAMATDRQVVEASTLTDGGSIAGTTSYMAPEQLEGAAADPRSDIFALGIVLYEMIAGRKPFEGASRARMIAAILEHAPAPLTSPTQPIPAAVEHAVMKCLAKDPLDRWQSARDLAGELAWLAQSSERNLEAVPTRRWSPAMAVPVAILAALIGLVVVVAQRDGDVAISPAPVRFLSAAPPNSVITVAAGAFSVSPDGRHLAFTAASGSGPRLLWIRSMDSFEARPLSGTDDAGFPFWSPDSRTIAFFTSTHIKTVDVDGSPLQIVSAVPEGTRPEWGSWGSQGDIIFTTVGILFRVRASGGTPEAILSRQQFPHLGIGGPEFLPDGRNFLLGVIEPDKPPDQVGIYVGSLQQPVPRLLLRADSQAIYAEPGYVLYIRAGSLVAQPFDPGTQQITGEPVTLPEPAGFFRRQRRASFSVSQTGLLTYRQGISTSQLTWFDRSGRRLGTVGAPGRYINPSIAPDASRIAVTRLSPSLTESDIWLFEPRGERPLTSSEGFEDYALWSPDGARIAYSANQGGFLDLFVKDTVASSQEPGMMLLQDDHQKLPVDWTPDGRSIVFLDSAGGLNPRLPLLYSFGGAHAGNVKDLTLSANPAASLRSEDQVQISPDGHWMAYASDVSGSTQVYVREFPSGQRRWQVSTDGGFEPKWRGDGRELFYVSADQQMMSVTVAANADGFEAGRPTPLFRTTVLGAPFQNGVVRNEYAVTRDGQRFLINEPIDGAAAHAIRVLVNWPYLLPAAPR